MYRENSLRDTWLASPDLQIESDAELKELLGLYTAEALEIIDKDNASRMKIILSDDAKIDKKRQALQSGVWYSNDYLSAVKKHPERFRYLQKREPLKNGYMSPKFWSSVGNHAFIWKGDSSSPAEEIVKILAGKSLCLLECMATFAIAQYAALLRVWGKDRFDRVFSGVEDYTLPLKISNYGLINPIYLFLEGEVISDINSICLGDKIGVRNHPLYSVKHPLGSSASWNIVCIELEPENKFVGFGFDGQRLTENEIKSILIEEYNKDVFNDDDILGGNARNYMSEHHQRFSNDDCPREIDVSDFEEAENTGCSDQLLRLDAKKVRMILDSPTENVSLLEVYEITNPGPISYAMEEKIGEQWKRAHDEIESSRRSLSF